MTQQVSWQILAQGESDLRAKFGTLGISVPDRTQPKDQFAEELYCLRRYLFPLADGDLLKFPIEIAKRETPDFILASEDRTNAGLEVTKATRKEFEADLTRFHRQRQTRNYVSDLASGTMLLSELGWAGNAPETEWVKYVLASIADKLNDISSYSVPDCDLLIYDNAPLPAPDLTTVAEAVRLRFVKEPLADANGRSFRVISVIRDPWLIYDIARAPRILKYNPAWDTTT